MRRYDLVLVEWQDSVGGNGEWIPVDKLKSARLSCFSAGWIVHEDTDAIVVVPHIHDKSDDGEISENGCGEITIPKVAIIGRKVLAKRAEAKR